jgi:putative sterol carrier protein
MSELIDDAVAALKKMLPDGFDGLAKFVIPGEGSIMLDASGPRAADEDADVTMTASAEVFQDIISGDTSPTVAFMTGKLVVDGNVGLAMKLASALG